MTNAIDQFTDTAWQYACAALATLCVAILVYLIILTVVMGVKSIRSAIDEP